MQNITATMQNIAFEGYDRYWEGRLDFHRYHPGTRHRRRLIEKAVSSLPGGSLLEIGCGPADWLASVKQRFPQFTNVAGADISSQIVEYNQLRHPNLRFFTLDIEQETLPERFDAILMPEVLEHLNHRQAAFYCLSKMLKPGGSLIITCPLGKVFPTEKVFGHTVHPTVAEIRSLSEKSGLRLENVQRWGWPIYTLQKWATNWNPQWALSTFASRNYGFTQIAISNLLYWINFLNLPGSRWAPQLIATIRK